MMSYLNTCRYSCILRISIYLSNIYSFVHKNIFKRCSNCWWNTYDDGDCGSFFNVCKKCYLKYWKD